MLVLETSAVPYCKQACTGGSVVFAVDNDFETAAMLVQEKIVSTVLDQVGKWDDLGTTQ